MEEYVVEAIQGWRFHLRNNRKEFYIKWQNYSEDENTWEPEEYLNCPEILQKFIENLDDKQKKFFHSERFDKLTGFQRNAEFKKVVGVDGPHSDSDQESSSKIDKQRFYILVTFEDSDYAEEVTTKEFYSYQPEAAFKFFESRLLIRKNKKRRESNESKKK